MKELDAGEGLQGKDLSRLNAFAVAVIGIAMSVYHLYTGYFGAPEAFLHRSIHLLFTMVLIFFVSPLSKKAMGEKISLDRCGFDSPDHRLPRLFVCQL